MDRKVWVVALVILIISVVALGVSVAAYIRASYEKISITEPPILTEEFEGPIYTGTGTDYVIEFGGENT